MNIVIGNKDNTIVVVTDPNVLAEFRFEAKRYMKIINGNSVTQYYIIIYLGNIKICTVGLYALIFHKQVGLGAIYAYDKCTEYTDEILMLKDTGTFLHLSQDSIIEFKKKYDKIKQICRRDLILSKRYCTGCDCDTWELNYLFKR